MKNRLLTVALAVVLIITAFFVSVACDDETKTFKFTKNELYILVGDEEELPIENADGVSFKSSNQDLLKINGTGIEALADGVGLLTATATVTATLKNGETRVLTVKIYKDEDSFIKEATDTYVVFRVLKSGKWRVGDLDKSYKEGETISEPSAVIASDGYNAPTVWYKDKEMTEVVDFQEEKMGATTTFFYGEEILRDGSSAADGAIDLEVAFDKTLGVYVATGLTYGELPYKNIVIPEKYAVDGNLVEIKGIADNAFYYDYKTTDGRRLNTGLQNLVSIDVYYVDYIGSAAFKNCLVLSDARMNTDVKIGEGAFDGTQVQIRNR